MKLLDDILSKYFYKTAGSSGSDAYDSSRPDYSERFNLRDDGPEYIMKMQRYQYRFRECLESRLENPSEPGEYSSRMIKSTAAMTEFCNDYGFDVSSYIRSRAFNERRELLKEKLRRRIARDSNREIDKTVADAAKSIKITDYALKKANYAARKISELSSKAGKRGSYELGMYMLSSSLKNDDDVVTDIYVAQEQVVTQGRCNITPEGVMKSLRDTKKSWKRIIGWAHSHGGFSTFFSAEDDETLLGRKNIAESSFFPMFLEKKVKGHLAPDDVVKYFLALVVNEKNDEPAYRIVAVKPRYFVENGRLRKKTEVIDLERTISENSEENWPAAEIAEEKSREIDAEIAGRVKFQDGTRLSDYQPVVTE